MDNAAGAFQKLIAKIAALDPADGPVDEAVAAEYKEKFRTQVGNDLNTSMGVTALYDALKAKANGATRLAILDSFDQVLSLSLLDKAAQVREEQKKQKTASQGGIPSPARATPPWTPRSWPGMRPRRQRTSLRPTASGMSSRPRASRSPTCPAEPAGSGYDSQDAKSKPEACCTEAAKRYDA